MSSERTKPKASLMQHSSPRRFIAISTIVALAYIGSGWLGLHMAAPPGYATVIWPASGLAVASLLMFGPVYMGAVFLGSFLLNAYVGGALSDGIIVPQAVMVAALIAAGSSTQALFAYLLIRRVFGIPIAFRNALDVGVFALITGPLTGLIAASVGTATLFSFGLIPASKVLSTWITWWSGDTIGILVFLPLLMLGPWRQWSVRWRNHPMTGLRIASITVVVVALGLTFYAWKLLSERHYNANQAAFTNIAEDHEKALSHRFDSYTHSLDGAAGLIRASNRITRSEWRTYLNSLNLSEALPGINGIGIISDVADADLSAFVAKAAIDGVENLQLHPEVSGPDNFIIRYIEPIENNRAAVGLNIAFERNRREAAIKARDLGLTTMTKRIFLVQDTTKSAGFLILRPVYDRTMPMDTIVHRREAFTGWVYAPFISTRFMDQLTLSQGDTLQVRIYDGEFAEPTQLIYASDGSAEINQRAHFTTSKVISILGQSWTIVWESTHAFEAAAASYEPEGIMAIGILLSLLLCLYLLSSARREDSIQRTVDQKTREVTAREGQTRSIVETAVVAILLLDEHGRVISANAAAIDTFGYTQAEMKSGSLMMLLGAKETILPSRFLNKLVKSHSKSSAENTTIEGTHKTGSKLQLDLQINGWANETGERRYTAILRDVTAQQQVKIALEEAEERWSIALRGGNIGVFDINLTTGKSVVSDTWLEMLGFSSQDEVESQAEWTQRIHADDLPTVRKADEACFSGQAERSVSEYRIKRKDDRWIWLRSDANVTARDAKGKALRFVGTQTDITELKNAEAAQRRSEQQLSDTIDNAPIGMALLSLEGHWMRVNDAVCQFLGYSSDELLQKTTYEFSHPDDLHMKPEEKQNLLDGKISSFQFEKRYIHKLGHAVWGLVSISLARHEDGTPSHFISQIMDVNDRREMDRLKSEFISNVSHELRTPLTSIRGSLGLVTGAMNKDIPDPVMRLLNIAHQNSERLVLLINDILDLEKLSADKTSFNLQSEDIAEEMRLAAEVNQGYADQFNVSFKLEIPKGKLTARVDKIRLQQIMSNLLSNASKFSPRDGEVTIKLSRHGKNLRIAVSDNGPGIPADFHSKIFTPFSQADGSTSRKTDGTGLGLHITKQMTERMGGKIGFTTVKDAGSTFFVDFPSVSAQTDQKKRQRKHQALALHVEDDTDFSLFLATALADTVHIENAPNLAKARELLETGEHDLLIVDVNLPDGNGLEILKNLPKDRKRPVIVLTADENIDIKHPVDLLLVKSKISEARLTESIRDIVRNINKDKPTTDAAEKRKAIGS